MSDDIKLKPDDGSWPKWTEERARITIGNSSFSFERLVDCEGIVRELSAMHPNDARDAEVCRFCTAEIADSTDTAMHYDDCVWARARKAAT